MIEYQRGFPVYILSKKQFQIIFPDPSARSKCLFNFGRKNLLVAKGSRKKSSSTNGQAKKIQKVIFPFIAYPAPLPLNGLDICKWTPPCILGLKSNG